tara:strand:- start:92 stop:1840 length:1749 start_codon:yes stop_codon:yes gene_type:complete
MPFIFQKRVLQKEDVLDPIELNEDLQTVKVVSGGNLDLENIEAFGPQGFKSLAIPAQEAYYKYHTATNKTVEPSFDTERPLTLNDEGVNQPRFDVDDPPADLFLVPNTNSWTVVANTTINITTGQANLWINGWLQYVRNGWSFDPVSFGADGDVATTVTNVSQLGLHHLSNGFFGSRVHFAIRVDGRVVEWTITGKQSIFSRSPLGMKPVQSLKKDEEKLPGTRVPDTRAVSPGPEVLPIRLGTIFPVEPGSHTIEIVARRLPRRKNVMQEKEDVIGVHSRELHVIEMPIHAVQTLSSDVSDKQVFVFESEDPVENSTLGSTVSNLAEENNDLKAGNIRREALFNTQLPSKVVSCLQTTINNDHEELKAAPHWPGTVLDTVSSSSFGWGWYQLRDASTVLEVVTEERFLDDDIIILMANISLRQLQVRGDQLFKDRFLDAFGAFRFGMRDNVTSSGSEDWKLSPTTGPGSTGYVNSFQWADALGGFSQFDAFGGPNSQQFEQFFGPELNVNVDIPLFTVLRGSDFEPTATKHYIGVFGASMAAVKGGPGAGPTWGDSTGGGIFEHPFINWNDANLILIHLRK